MALEDRTGESSSNSRTMSSSSLSGKSSSGPESLRGDGVAGGVGLSEKSRSCVESKARRSAGSLSAAGGVEACGGGGGVGGCAVEKALGVRLAVGGVGGGESSRWIWVLLTKKSSRLSSGMATDWGGAGVDGASWRVVEGVGAAGTGRRGGVRNGGDIVGNPILL